MTILFPCLHRYTADGIPHANVIWTEDTGTKKREREYHLIGDRAAHLLMLFDAATADESRRTILVNYINSREVV